MLENITRKDGLADDEGVVGDHVAEAFNAFARLPVQHPDDLRDVADVVHRVQDILAMRIARRHYPAGWPIKQGKPASETVEPPVARPAPRPTSDTAALEAAHDELDRLGVPREHDGRSLKIRGRIRLMACGTTLPDARPHLLREDAKIMWDGHDDRSPFERHAVCDGFTHGPRGCSDDRPIEGERTTLRGWPKRWGPKPKPAR